MTELYLIKFYFRRRANATTDTAFPRALLLGGVSFVGDFIITPFSVQWEKSSTGNEEGGHWAQLIGCE